jgi:adenosylmethionine-8-amino-7-oxononanoate aminotransferase
MTTAHTNASLIARDLRVLWHPCTQMKDHEGELPLLPIRSGCGAWLRDYDGRQYLDAIGSWWVNVLGHAHPAINAALHAQLDTLEHVMFAGFTHEPAIALAEKLLALAPPGLTKCYFADSGSNAIEIALKMSYHFWQNSGRPRKTRFITLSNSYHGETLGALAVGSVELYKSIYRPLLMDVITAPSPDAYQRLTGESATDCAARQAQALEDLLRQNADEVAAVILEPLVQCAGNMRMYDASYLSTVRALCDRYGVHLIADEIAVGMGRTGRMFACEHAGITPDFLCLSKGLSGGYLALSAVLTTEPVYRAFYDEYAKLNGFLHSHSFSGNPLACTAALATLDVFAATDVLQTVRRLSDSLAGSMAVFRSHPHVSDVRQCGLIGAIEFVRERTTRAPFDWRQRRNLRIYRHALERGVILRPLGNVIYFMPPYIVTPAEIALMCTVAMEGLELATCD